MNELKFREISMFVISILVRLSNAMFHLILFGFPVLADLKFAFDAHPQDEARGVEGSRGESTKRVANSLRLLSPC